MRLSVNAIYKFIAPRDPGWRGTRCVGLGDEIPGGKIATEDDVKRSRELWARKLIDRCIDRGLQCIAITDHHEMVMTHYLMRELQFREVIDEAANVWVLPGMELTLEHGCQSIVLFDADLETKWWTQAQSSLGIAVPAIEEFAGAAKAPMQLAFPYSEIADRLNEVQELKGRFIVLPNVSEGGQHTVLRTGFHRAFREMPYVGGYLDAGQRLQTCNATNRTRMSGNDATWGDRFIYPLPTSDSRDAGYPHLASNDTWIKLSAPSAEALRQAFLASKSRIRTEIPAFASVTITHVTIKGGKPLADLELDLSPELNTVIGGRGSGKSTLLEYTAFAIGRSCYDLTEKNFSGKQRLVDLIQDTLISQSAEVSVTATLDGADFTITRNLATAYRPCLRYPSGQIEIVTAQELRNLMPAYVYSQGELSELGSNTHEARVSDLLAFVDSSFKSEAEELEAAIQTAKERYSEAVRNLLNLWRTQNEKRKIENRVAAVRARIKALQSTLPKLLASDQAILDTHATFVSSSQEVNQAVEDAEAIADTIGELGESLASVREIAEAGDDRLAAVATALSKAIKPTSEQIKQLGKTFDKDLEGIRTAAASWNAHVAAHEKKRDEIIAKVGKQKTAAKQVAELQAQAASEAAKLTPIEKRIKALGDPTVEIRLSQNRLEKSAQDQLQRLKEWGTIIETLSNGIVTVRIEEAGDLSEISAALEIAAARTRSQEGIRTRRLAELVAAQGAWPALSAIRSEAINLMQWKISGDNDDKQLPPINTIASVLGDGDMVRKAFIEHVDETRTIALTQAAPRPRVHLDYKSGSSGSVPFEKASEGQRAAVLLMMLLKQAGGPLLVDQPEGDLDNAVITTVVDLLHEVKDKRQLIFATHNANLVVNGASEFVIAMNNDDSGARRIECEGAIDQSDVRLAITDTMEGGKQAFRDRQRKYGF